LNAEAGKSKAVATALAAFAENDAAGGLDALEAEAQRKSRAALADWKRIGALAFASDTRRAIRAGRSAPIRKLKSSRPTMSTSNRDWLGSLPASARSAKRATLPTK
jgi:hypothetical protein